MAGGKTILDAIGRTPLVALSKLSISGPGEIWAKVESLNPGGSHKARIAKAMIEASERDGVLVRHSGMTILEATGGNTGMGIAIAGAVYGYHVVLVVPDNYSEEKCRRLELLGARVERADSTIGDNPHGRRATELQLENPDWVMLGQASNPANPEVHRLTTGPEILAELPAGSIRFLVAGIGTGGHITGVGEVLKRASEAIEVVGVQPEGCDLLSGRFVAHEIQGIAVGLVPPVLQPEVIDEMHSVSYEQAVAGAQALLREEGISAGLSSGANLAVAQGLLSRCGPGQRILTFVYDSADDYPELSGT